MIQLEDNFRQQRRTVDQEIRDAANYQGGTGKNQEDQKGIRRRE